MTTKTEISSETIPSIKPTLDEFIEGAVNATNNALSPIIPMLGVVTSLINEIFIIHENAQFNKRMTKSIINRILSVEITIKSLNSQTKYSEKFQDLQHQESFVKFQATLKKIKMFVETDTQAPLYQEICNVKNQLEKTKYLSLQIDPTLLKDSTLSRKSDCRSKLKQVTKMVYKGFIEVACKSRDSEDQRFHRELLILGKLDKCQNVEKFYGFSKIDGKEVMVFEWVEMGNLEEIYNKERISWSLKARIVFEICKGIMFLGSVGIFHNDIRCENIMMSRFMEPKLANFHSAILHNETNIEINQPIDAINWMAPEKMRKLLKESEISDQIPYSQKGETF
ncbi:14173_t:CDS:2, partial [Dentiscutata erythropus]